MKNKLISAIILSLIFCLAFYLRTYRIDNAIADWHSWRQADTAAITRNFVKEGFTPLFPKFDALVALNTYKDKNVNRYFFAEFPLYNIITYPFYKYFGVNTVYHRLVSIFFSSLTTIFLYLLVKNYSSKFTAYLSAFIFTVLPFSIYYGRVIMPDPLYVFLSVLSLWLVTLWLKHDKFYLAIVSGISIGLTILTKPYGLVLGLPIAILILQKFVQTKKIRPIPILIIVVLSLVPFILWKKHTNLYPEGQFETIWLYNSTNIRFRPAFFRWLIFQRLNNIILGGGGFALFILGLIAPKTNKENLFYYSWFIGLTIFVVIIATGNVTHDYYQLPFIPLISIFVAKGFENLIKIAKKPWQYIFNTGVGLSLMAMMLGLSWYQVKDYFNINNHSIVHAGQKADQILPKDALVIAPYLKDPAFLYQTNRYGWTTQLDNLDQVIEKYDHPIYLVSVNMDDYTNSIIQNYTTIYKNDEFVIVKIK